MSLHAKTENIPAGILWMLATIFCFVSLDTSMKYALVTLQLPLTQVVWARFVFATLITLAVMGRSVPRQVVSRKPGLQLWRSILLMTTTVLFNAGLVSTPIATASTITFLTPFLVTALSIPLLGEHVGPRRWAGIAVGFLGALIVVHPSPGHIPLGALLVLCAAFSNALYQIATRQLHAADSAMTSLFYTGLVGAVLASIVVPFVWVAPSALGWWMMLQVGVFGGVGHLCIIQAFKRAPASAVVPFSYSSLVWATLFGFVIFGEWPPATTFIGAGIIIASGLYIFNRERIAAKG